MIAPQKVREIVLIGGGHTHLHTVKRWERHAIPQARLTLISALKTSTYSGMIPGVLAGQYHLDEAEIDLVTFSERSGVRFIEAAMTGLNSQGQEVLLGDHSSVPFDVASIGIGSVPHGGAKWRSHPNVVLVKPINTFVSRLESQFADLMHDQRTTISVVIVGGGAAGVELACCLHGKFRGMKEQPAIGITLLESNEQLLGGFREKTRKLAVKALEEKGITIKTGQAAMGYQSGQLELADRSTVTADLVIWVTGAAPPVVLEQVDLPKADDGFLAVDDTHLTTGNCPVFVVGDTATRVEDPVPKAGVFAVREGPVFWKNLQRKLNGQPLVPYRPQRDFLRLLNTGDFEAIGQYKWLSGQSPWLWRFKDILDRRFLRQYRHE